ncbi:ORF [Satellite tobacco mosaic virus]|uniref:6.8 kDa protein n=1 Tax=Satellite tobacco mosaic virus TaxID=12881 RepID=V07K_STMV|nr:RecName: Full=6.8 kDa protein [Satellite tobacco mosaic virus]AAA47784.1 ORF [Satellite tobacco mosaic virus]
MLLGDIGGKHIAFFYKRPSVAIITWRPILGFSCCFQLWGEVRLNQTVNRRVTIRMLLL